MNNIYLENALPFLKEMDTTKREQFCLYFKTAPKWIIDSFIVEKMEKGRVFIQEGSSADTVYFILDGFIKATDYRVYGIKFDFILFTNMYAYGGLEVIMELDKFQTSLETATNCTVLKIPRSTFSRWLQSDPIALKHEAKLMGEYMLDQSRSVRSLLFLQGPDRLSFLFVNRYNKFAHNGSIILENDRQELSDYTGLCVKTITRSLKKLEEDGLITRKGKQIIITEKQFIKLKDSLALVLAEGNY